MVEPLLVARGLVVAYPLRRGGFGRRATRVTVLRDVDLAIGRGESLGIVGESGSGKTTLGRALLGLVAPERGSVMFDGVELTGLDEAARRPYRRRMQMIFQDPMSCLNPRHRIGRILTGPMLLHGLAPDRAAALAAARHAMARFGLPAPLLEAYPHELSGGQRQRIGIARAVLLRPDVLLADEITSGLDVSTKAQVLDLIGQLRRDMGLTLIFISHDLAVVRAVCDRVMVMREGRVEETGACERVFAEPAAEYTRRLIAAVPPPIPDPLWLGLTPLP